jgi:hypothetical protein
MRRFASTAVSLISTRAMASMSGSTPVIQSVSALGFPFETSDPWLFAVYHKDEFPEGDEKMRVPGGKRGNGADFELNERKRWRFYHGDRVPGFPQHPHKGMETFTIVLEGAVDHSDSLGSSGRYGAGDAQWMSAGRGIVHGESFPLIEMVREVTRVALFARECIFFSDLIRFKLMCCVGPCKGKHTQAVSTLAQLAQVRQRCSARVHNDLGRGPRESFW